MADEYGWERQLRGADGDLQEEDVWAMMSNNKDEGSSAGSLKAGSSNPVSSSTHHGSGRRPSGNCGSRMIPRSSSSHGQAAGWASRQSAPVNIPDWSKFYGTGPDGPAITHYSRSDRGGRVGLVDAGSCNDGYLAAEGEDDVEDEDAMVPPHEWLAKKLAGTPMSSSMFEGVGRTLKGRDLRRVRNAVLTKTGFLEQ